MHAKPFFKFLIIILFASVFTSCNLFNDDDEPQIKDEYLVSYELIKSYYPDLIESLFDQFADDFPEIAAVQDKIEHGVMIYEITYNTTFNGNPQRASGLVCVPLGEGPFPVMSYQNGTNTLYGNAPSVNPDRDLYVLLEFMASTGMVITIPDYLGFGESEGMFHPYLHEESTVNTVLDMLRAVEELTENYLEIAMSDELYITGYSQGGWATMQVQKAIEEQYADEFNLQASACAAGPYDLLMVNNYIMEQSNYPMPYYVGYLFNSYINLGLVDLQTGEIFQEPYASKIPDLFDGSKTGEQINDELTTTVADLFTTDYLNNYNTGEKYSSVTEALNENSIDAWNTKTPTRLIHGTDDEFVPIQVSSDMYQDFISKGVDEEQLTLIPLPGEDHISAIIPAGLIAVQWFLEMQQQ